MTETIKRLSILVFSIISAGVMLASDTLVMKNGSTHTGTFVSASSATIAFREGRTLHRYPRSQVRSVEFGTSGVSSTASATNTAAPKLAARTAGSSLAAHSVTVPAGTEIVVLSNEKIDSKAASEGQVFSADVAENVTNSSGQVVIPKGSPAELVIRRVSGGNITGGSELALDLQSVKVGGNRYVVSTQDLEQKGTQGIGANRRTAEMVGGGAALGTLIGAVAGGGKGAAVGAIAGAGAGTGAEVLTRGKTVEVPAESKLRFRLDQPLQLQSVY